VAIASVPINAKTYFISPTISTNQLANWTTARTSAYGW